MGEASDGLEAVSEIERLRPEVVFLDVQMPGLTGLEVLGALPAGTPSPLVIFVTAYDEYALAAFEANAVGYLVKPVKRERLAVAIERARRLASGPEVEEEVERARRAAGAAAPVLRHVVCRRRDRFVLVPVEQILQVYVDDAIVRVQTDDATLRTDCSLNDLASRLPDPPFFRAHRSAIVNMERVREIAPFFNSTFLLVLDDAGKSEIQTSERQAKKLREMLKG